MSKLNSVIICCPPTVSGLELQTKEENKVFAVDSRGRTKLPFCCDLEAVRTCTCLTQPCAPLSPNRSINHEHDVAGAQWSSELYSRSCSN